LSTTSLATNLLKMKSVQLIASTVLLAAQVRAADSLFGFYPGKSSLVA
jgi:hypothetical protein